MRHDTSLHHNDCSHATIIGINYHQTGGSQNCGAATVIVFRGKQLNIINLTDAYNPKAVQEPKEYTPQSLYDELTRSCIGSTSYEIIVDLNTEDTCLLADFIFCFSKISSHKWDIRIETTLSVPARLIDILAPVIDFWAVDIKIDDPILHKTHIGKPRQHMPDMLRHLTDDLNVDKNKILIRVPVIPGLVTEEQAHITECEYNLKGFTRSEIVSYNNVYGHCKKTFLKECPVAGLPFHIESNDELWYELSEGEELALYRDKNNCHDNNAVAVLLTNDITCLDKDEIPDYIIGYIPRSANSDIAARLDNEERLTAEIASIRRSGPVKERITVKIYKQDNGGYVSLPPRLLRAQTIDTSAFQSMQEQLSYIGVAYFRWGGYNSLDLNLPDKGDKVVTLYKRDNTCVLYLLHVLATGSDCAMFFDDSSELLTYDDCRPYILSNIAGPVTIPTFVIDAITGGEDEELSVTCPLSDSVSNKFTQLFNTYLDGYRLII